MPCGIKCKSVRGDRASMRYRMRVNGGVHADYIAYSDKVSTRYHRVYIRYSNTSSKLTCNVNA